MMIKNANANGNWKLTLLTIGVVGGLSAYTHANIKGTAPTNYTVSSIEVDGLYNINVTGSGGSAGTVRIWDEDISAESIRYIKLMLMWSMYSSLMIRIHLIL